MGKQARFLLPAAVLTLALPVIAQQGSFEQPSPGTEKRLENLLNQIDRPSAWKDAPAAPAQPQQPPPQQQAPPWSRSMVSAGQLGSMLRGGGPWKALGTYQGSVPNMGSYSQPAPGPDSQFGASPYVPGGIAGGPNPFNLTPFGVLHYLWDPTTYVSSSNPITLTDVRNDLQLSQHYAQLAQSAAQRARYASTAEERQQAAAQAQQYAGLAQQAANRANQVSEAGSSNPAEVAALAQEQAQRAQQLANEATASAHGRW